MAVRTDAVLPPIWKNGIGLKKRSAPVSPKRPPMPVALRNIWLWRNSTPLGNAVVPEVYWTINRSPGSTRALALGSCAAAITSADCSNSSHAICRTAPRLGDPPSVTTAGVCASANASVSVGT